MGIPLYANLCVLDNDRVSECYTGVMNRTAPSKTSALGIRSTVFGKPRGLQVLG